MAKNETFQRYTSTQYCDGISNAYEAKFAHDRGDKTIIIRDKLVTTQNVARERARSELLNGGYKKKYITIQTIYVKGLKQNDIISFKGINWIVKEINISYLPPVLTYIIKGLRYE